MNENYSMLSDGKAMDNHQLRIISFNQSCEN